MRLGFLDVVLGSALSSMVIGGGLCWSLSSAPAALADDPQVSDPPVAEEPATPVPPTEITPEEAKKQLEEMLRERDQIVKQHQEIIDRLKGLEDKVDEEQAQEK